MQVSSTARGKPEKTGRIHDAIEQLAVLVDVFERRRETLASEAGVTVEQWRVIEEIARRRFMPSMFARNRESSAAAVSRVLRQLLDANLVSVAVSKSDGRNREYRLTTAGAQVLANLRKSRKEAIRSVWMMLNSAEIERFTGFVKMLVGAIEEYSARGNHNSCAPKAGII